MTEGRKACVYKITNVLNGMVYIGVSIDYKTRFVQGHCKSNSYLGFAIRKHGVVNFKLEQLLVASEEYCYYVEPRLIAAQDCIAPKGYNRLPGGRTVFGYVEKAKATAERRAKSSASNKGKKHGSWGRHTEEAKRAIGAKNSANLTGRKFGPRNNPELSRKLSELNKGKPSPLKGTKRPEHSLFMKEWNRKRKEAGKTP